MLAPLIVLCFFVACTWAAFDFSAFGDSNGGGAGCAACTIVVSLVEQLSVLHNKPIQIVLEDLCRFLPATIRPSCVYFVDMYSVDITRLIEQDGANPDQVCHGIKICTDPQCKMYPATRRRAQPSASRASVPPPHSPKFDPWAWLKHLLLAVGRHEPEVDLDGDGFSSFPTLRGYNWRGKDCGIFDAAVHPGRRVPPSGANDASDYNCNGISGIDPSTQKPWKEVLCAGTPHYGIMALGDSAGAHFQIPPEYMTAAKITEHTFDNVLEVLSNEIDLPHLGGYTGYFNSTPGVMVDSMYLRMREHNRCIHRDFQNLCVNGLRSSTVHEVISTIARNQTLDAPQLVFLELIGNDVCNSHVNTSHMTTVPEFRRNILAALRQLDTILPKGSHVVTVGLANGLVLWDSMHNRTHPIGVTYKVVYDFLNCLSISPCRGWMNSDRSVREFTQQRANNLSAVYSEIINTHKFTNFDMAYTDFPLKGILKAWKAKGGELWQLIEPIDGFHPNQVANALMAPWVWNWLAQEHPTFLGPANPNNAKIDAMFGNQGGYS